MSWLRALKETARSGLTVERRRLEPVVAARAALGLALVVGFSLALFGPAVAAASAFGAFQAAIATFQRSWRPRPTLALASGASLALSTFFGYLTAAHGALFLALLLLWTFLAGLAWAAGPTAGIIASSNVAMMLVTVTLPTSVATAAGHAAMIFAGGVVQAALVVVLPVRRWGAQRDALADALAAEADYARRLRHDPVAPFDPLPLMTARSAAAVTPGQARRRPAELHGARGLAERIRPVLASLADPAVGVPEEGPQRARVRELLGAAGAVLDAAAHAIRHGEPVALPAPAMAALRTPDTGAILTGPSRRAALRLAALLGDVVETAEPRTETTGTPGHGTASALARPSLVRMAPVVAAKVRGELRRDSPVLRHAVRVSVVTATGYLLGGVLPFGHGFWAPMASVMVMRPDFSQTYARSVARFGGTLIGVALATAVVQSAHPGTYLSAALSVVCAFGMYLLMRTGYAAGQVFVAAYVVFLLGMQGADLTQTVRDRVTLTLLGGLLAMLAYAVYPAWETPRLHGRLADWLASVGGVRGRRHRAVRRPGGHRQPRRPQGAPGHARGPGRLAGGGGPRDARTGAAPGPVARGDGAGRPRARGVRPGGDAPGGPPAGARRPARAGRRDPRGVPAPGDGTGREGRTGAQGAALGGPARDAGRLVGRPSRPLPAAQGRRAAPGGPRRGHDGADGLHARALSPARPVHPEVSRPLCPRPGTDFVDLPSDVIRTTGRRS
ncbi:FUSC family protein [Streptomyces sp. NPDC012693]|uniref:FUSC family protein n=1 Tax=Streptomyces sp. NPDC012693 TaxID=3364844 RepID=UPI0036A723DA